MHEPEKDPKGPLQTNVNFSAAGLAGQIGCVVPAIILAAVLGGLWLDKTFDTNRIFTLILLLASLPLSIYLTFALAMRTVKSMNANLKPPATAKPSQPKEDETGDE